MVWMGAVDGFFNMKSVCQILNTNATKSQNQVVKGIYLIGSHAILLSCSLSILEVNTSQFFILETAFAKAFNFWVLTNINGLCSL